MLAAEKLFTSSLILVSPDHHLPRVAATPNDPCSPPTLKSPQPFYFLQSRLKPHVGPSTVFCGFCLWTLTLPLHRYTELFSLESQVRQESENVPYLHVSYNADTLIVLTTCHTSIHCFFAILPFPPINHPLLRCQGVHTP